MASTVPPPNLGRILLQPLRGPALLAVSIGAWLAGAAYCHLYQSLLTGMHPGAWAGSLSWSAIAVVPWFALFEWSKQTDATETMRRPALLASLVIGIAAFSISIEYLVDFCLGDVTDRFGLLVMRRLPAIGVTILLITVARKAVIRQPAPTALTDLSALAATLDWVEAADNYIELHGGGKVTLRRMTMRDAERALGPRGFVRIHRRYLVNRGRIANILGTNGDRIVQLASGAELPVGRAFAANLKD